MPIDPEDPRLTAYALGELEDDERNDLERLLSESDEGRRIVEEVRVTARLLARSLAEEVTPGVTPTLMKTIESEIAAPSGVAFLPTRAWLGYGIAASLLLGFGLSAAWLVSGPAATDRLVAVAAKAPAPAMPKSIAPMASPDFDRDALAAQPPPMAMPAPAAIEAASAPAKSEVKGKILSPHADAQSPSATTPSLTVMRDAERTAGDTTRSMASAAVPPPPRVATGAATDPSNRRLDVASGRKSQDEYAASEVMKEVEGATVSSGIQRGAGFQAAKPESPAKPGQAQGQAKPGQPQTRGDQAGMRGMGGAGGGMGGMGGGGMRGMGGAMGEAENRTPGRGRLNENLAKSKAARNVEDASNRKYGEMLADGIEQDKGATASMGRQTRFRSAAPSVVNGPQGIPGDAKSDQASAKEKLERAQSQLAGSLRLKAKSPVLAKKEAELGLLEQKGAEAQDHMARAGQKPADADKLFSLKLEEQKQNQDGEKQDRVPIVDPIPGEFRPEVAAAVEAPGTEAYAKVEDNPFKASIAEPLSTFSTDVDTASYANIRRFLMAENRMPPKDAVRIEEMVNYFPYDYPAATTDKADAPPFSVNVEVARCPWNADHRLAKIGLKGKVEAKRLVSNLVFLVDVSGSMDEPNKLRLVQASLRMLADQLGENDRVALVVYAGAAGMVLDSTSGLHKAEIASAIDQLKAGGSTAGGAGINLAYDVARKHFVNGGTNRVILCTDGDFNVGVSDDKALEALAAEKAKTNVFLTVLGFGTGNVKDAKMEGIADKGNGHYHYIDSLLEARKVLVEQMVGTLVTIAKDVKVQVDFNPAKVGSYRLIGYENRILAAQDFNNDAKDAGEIGAGHTVTAFYELTPPEKDLFPKDLVSRYVKTELRDPKNGESFTVKLRYKQPDGTTSSLIEQPVTDGGKDFAGATEDFKFASSVAAFGMILRDSPHKGNASFNGLLEWAESGKGKDPSGYRKEFCEIVKKARDLSAAK